MNDLALVIFTVMAQLAVGMYGTLALLRLSAGNAAGLDVHALDKAMLYALPIFAIGLIASTTHLGQPFNGPNFLRGLLHGSPLSIEVATCLAFAGAGVAYGLVTFTGRFSGLKLPLLLLSLFLAVGVLVAMSRLYFVAAVPVWNSIWTPTQFTLTSATLGVTGTMALLHLMNAETHIPAPKALAVVAILVVSALLASVAGYQAWLAALDPAPAFDALPAHVAQLYGLRLVAIATGLVVIVWTALRTASVLYAVAFVLLLAGEIMGRINFFELRSGVGL